MELNAMKGKPFCLTTQECDWVEKTLSAMSAREKCAQLFTLLGDNYSEEALHDIITSLGIGGVLFRPAKKEDVRRKFEEADRFAKIPLLKAANLEEGGAGVLTDGTFFGNALQIAAADDPACTEAYAQCCAKEGREAGVNWTFSPVVDIDINFQNPITNVRTFGSDAAKVLKHGKTCVETLQAYGMAASCKHFPGDGVDDRDQHNHPTYNTLSAADWFATYGKVYQGMIESGLLSIMVGHIVQPNVIHEINPDAPLLPGSQSKEMMTGVLRERFGFNGLIITDATLMGGYTMTMPRREALPMSIMAGADMLCFSTDIEEDVSYLEAALQDGRLGRKRLDEAVMRILALKAVLNRTYPMPELDCRSAQRQCADRAVTLVKDNQKLIPVTKERFSSIRLIMLGEEQGYDGSLREITAALLEQKGFSVQLYDPAADSMHGPGKLPKDRLTLILCNCPTASFKTSTRITWTGGLSLELPRFVQEEAIAFISFSNPYHLQDVPMVKTYINAYSATEAAVKAAIEKLLGESAFTGVNPVDPFCGLPDTH